MFPIPFTRFNLPNGHQTQEITDVSPELFALWETVRDAGFRMTVELLTTGEVSMCIEDTKSDLGDFDMALALNGPDVPIALERLLRRFSAQEAQIWRLQFADPENH